ncbi:MAG TPA: nicotinate (nicotinamide) nucleotide adenylyltransferase [Myxococcales bacterium]|nr:nicotinate (nicotinamide) nucleotide adenylyltransferase [Myxococcales bacterium]HIN86433.1 nicotinate (nicotinamide) nucleotide adenylyltransferase [Myxococcales bacterium]
MIEAPKRVAFFGGSFNPPHIGHGLLITWALSIGEVDQVWLVPCNLHAFSKKLAAFEDRLEMCRLLAAPFDPQQVKTCAIEGELGGENRTIDTILALKKRHPNTSFRLLIGADVLEEREQWKRFDELMVLSPPIIVGREGYSPPAGYVVSPPLIQLSSNKIREQLKSKKSVWDSVPHNVVEYVRTHRLYR